MPSDKLSLPSQVDVQRRNYARIKGMEVHNKLFGVEERDRSLWLAQWLDEILKEYTYGMEQIAKEMERIARDAITLQPPPVIILRPVVESGEG